MSGNWQQKMKANIGWTLISEGEYRKFIYSTFHAVSKDSTILKRQLLALSG